MTPPISKVDFMTDKKTNQPTQQNPKAPTESPGFAYDRKPVGNSDQGRRIDTTFKMPATPPRPPKGSGK